MFTAPDLPTTVALPSAPPLPAKLCSKCGEPYPGFRRSYKCAGCEQDYDRNRYQEKRRRALARPQHKEASRKIKQRHMTKLHAEIDRLKSVPCKDCGGAFPPYVMDFDHRDPSTKECEISTAINKDLLSWARLSEETAKCDVVCVCCHRLRSWVPPKVKEARKELTASLKNVPCTDCGGSFHYCQMDFDHVRGVKIKPVSHMKSMAAIVAEAAKCQVVCANCHRERSHKKPSPQAMRRSAPVFADLQDASWQALAGTMSDRALARQVGVPFLAIFQFRSMHGIPKYTKVLPWRPLAGTITDRAVAELTGISRLAVLRYRKRMGIPSFRASNQMNMESTDG